MTIKNENLITRSFIITNEIDHKLTQLAKRAGISKSQILRMILLDYFSLIDNHVPPMSADQIKASKF